MLTESDSYLAALAIQVSASDIAIAMTRPSVLFKPSLTKDGNQWCFLLGPNLQDGVAGFGDTPEQAAAAFDAEWKKP
jgi:hypothetical protein